MSTHYFRISSSRVEHQQSWVIFAMSLIWFLWLGVVRFWEEFSLLSRRSSIFATHFPCLVCMSIRQNRVGRIIIVWFRIFIFSSAWLCFFGECLEAALLSAFTRFYWRNTLPSCRVAGPSDAFTFGTDRNQSKPCSRLGCGISRRLDLCVFRFLASSSCIEDSWILDWDVVGWLPDGEFF
jgi:hypothetical protein